MLFPNADHEHAKAIEKKHANQYLPVKIRSTESIFFGFKQE
jgi:hypothetical protein